MHRIDIDLQRSRILTCLLTAVLVGGCMIIGWLPFDYCIRFFIGAIAAVYSFCAFKSHFLGLGKHDIKGLTFNAEGWFLKLGDKVVPVAVRGESTISRFASILRFEALTRQKIYNCCIFKDSMSAENYRRMLVILRTNASYNAERVRKARFV